MATFTGEMTTYLQVRRFVEANFGTLDEDSEYQLLVYMNNALGEAWADLKDWNYFLSTWTITPVEGVYALPADVARICSATGVVEGEGEEPDVSTEYTLHEDGCTSSSCRPMGGNTVTWGCGSPGALSATVGADAIVPEDEPDSITLVGYRFPSKEFFTVEVVDDETCREWADIDLPQQFRTIFAKSVLGMMFFGCGDAARGADWLNLANGEFANQKRATRTGRSGQAQSQMLYQMGSRSYLGPAPCCTPTENWRWTL